MTDHLNAGGTGDDKYRDLLRSGADGEASYYRYGPYQPPRSVPAGGDNLSRAEPSDDEAKEITVAETTAPAHPAISEYGAIQGSERPGSVYGSGKRSSWKSMFAAFMAGVVVVGSLMFASDRLNLFTPDQAVSGGDNGRSAASAAGGSGPIRQTALDISRPDSIAEIVEAAQSAVVKIETYSRTSSRMNPMFNDPFFRYFFGDDFNRRGQSNGDRLVQIGSGSGFVFDGEGYILTNQHVIDGADEVRVYVEGYDDYFKAEVLGESYDLDLAALKIDGDRPFSYLELGDADELRVGDWVVAIGNPYGYDHTVTVGVLSAKGRPIRISDSGGVREYKNLLQTDASINPGNSGGPLLNLKGEVIGINTAVNAQAQGIGFAIPTSTISQVLDNLKNDTPIPKEPAPYIGVGITNLDGDTAGRLGYKGTDGALVTQVELGSPAHRAGIQTWDVIMEVGGTKIKNTDTLTKTIQSLKVGEEVTVKVFRLGETRELKVTIGDRNAQS